MAKILCLYNKHMLKDMYNTMVKNNVHSLVDPSNTVWFLDDVEDYLVNQYGMRRLANGGVI